MLFRSTQVADSSQSLSQGATEQASSLEEISASMNEMANRTKTNAENAGKANRNSVEARDSAQKCNAQMGQMVAAMDDMRRSGADISRRNDFGALYLTFVRYNPWIGIQKYSDIFGI